MRAISIARFTISNPLAILPAKCWRRTSYRCGTDLVDLLLRVSLGETPAPLAEGRAGVRTHLAMQALLGSASRDGTRRDLIRECGRIAAGDGLYRGSTEELTPVRLD